MTAPVLVDGLAVDYSSLPSTLRDGMQRYVEQSIRPGDFLFAVLQDKLSDSVLHCTHEALTDLPEIVRWLIWSAPPDCYGSAERVKAWLGNYVMEKS